MGILDPKPLTKQAADAAYATPTSAAAAAKTEVRDFINLPTAAIAAGSNGVYNPARVAYNFKPSNTRKLRAGLAKAYAGTGSLKLAFGGDSTTAGFPGDADQHAPAIVVRKMLASAGYPIKGTGPVIPNARGANGTGTNQLDSRWAFSGTWTSQASNINGILETTVAGATATFVSDVPGDVVEFKYLDLGATLAFDWSVDGVAQTRVTGTNTGNLLSVSKTGLANTTHTLVVTAVTGTLRPAWADVRSSGSGVWIGNFGVGGSTASIWDRTENYFPGPVLVNWVPDVGLLDLGINDLGGATSTATFKTQLQSVINKWKAVGTEVILVTNNPTEGKDYADYNKAKYELADTNDLPLIDIHELMESYTNMNTLGLMTDAAHPAAAGYGVKGSALFKALT